MLVALIIAGVIMIIYEIADFAEGILDEVPVQYYKIFHVSSYLITILMGLSFVLCDKDQIALRILIIFCGIFWLTRCILDWLTYVGIEQEAIDALEKMDNDEKKDE